MPARRSTPTARLSAGLLLAGSLIFVAGGAQHPKAASAFGAVGSDEFYRTFATHIAHQANWIPIHVLILMGPLFWALGAPRRLLSPHDQTDSALATAAESLASRALLLGAALWAVAFVLDGFVAPSTAAVIQTAAPADLPGLLVTFRVHQVTMVRLGLVSWILIGVAMATYGVMMLAHTRAFSGRGILGALGVGIGLWPIVAAVTGEFDPGPFTSPLWNLTALVSAFWFAAFGVSLGARVRASAVPSAHDPTPTLIHQH
jgi:hypothetical protein